MTTPARLINQTESVMNSTEQILLGVLKFKSLQQGVGGDIVDHLLASDPAQADQITRNVCARIPLELSQRLDSYTDLIGLNKREIINLALVDFLDKAEALMTEYDAWPKSAE